MGKVVGKSGVGRWEGEEVLCIPAILESYKKKLTSLRFEPTTTKQNLNCNTLHIFKFLYNTIQQDQQTKKKYKKKEAHGVICSLAQAEIWLAVSSEEGEAEDRG